MRKPLFKRRPATRPTTITRFENKQFLRKFSDLAVRNKSIPKLAEAVGEFMNKRSNLSMIPSQQVKRGIWEDLTQYKMRAKLASRGIPISRFASFTTIEWLYKALNYWEAQNAWKKPLIAQADKMLEYLGAIKKRLEQKQG